MVTAATAVHKVIPGQFDKQRDGRIRVTRVGWIYAHEPVVATYAQAGLQHSAPVSSLIEIQED